MNGASPIAETVAEPLLNPLHVTLVVPTTLAEIEELKALTVDPATTAPGVIQLEVEPFNAKFVRVPVLAFPDASVSVVIVELFAPPSP